MAKSYRCLPLVLVFERKKMHVGNCGLTLLGSLDRLERRSLIELYCNVANLLPIDERMLFHMYYKHGYSTIEISQLLMKNDTTIARRLKKIGEKLTKLIEGKKRVGCNPNTCHT